MNIPVISTESIGFIELDSLIQTGFCYLKMPELTLSNDIQMCLDVALKFFHGKQDEKNKWRLKEKLAKGDRYQGYVLRSQSKNTNAVEQIFFEPDAPFGPYVSYSIIIKKINDVFTKQIFIPLMRSIFKRLELSDDDLNEAIREPYCSLVFQRYPSTGEDKNVIRLNAHKDFGLITVLYFTDPGLEIYYEEAWHIVPSKPGYLIVNLGNAIEKITGNLCHSALHRVTNATDDRMSMVYFFNANYQRQVKNFIDNTIIAATGEEFFREQFSEYYEIDH